jgi:hypothetical protein
MFDRDVRMTTGASISLVHRPGHFGFIHEQWDADTGSIGLIQRLIGVAVQTSGIGIFFSGDNRKRQEQKEP